jgi:hypothetical protein
MVIMMTTVLNFFKISSGILYADICHINCAANSQLDQMRFVLNIKNFQGVRVPFALELYNKIILPSKQRL